MASGDGLSRRPIRLYTSHEAPFRRVMPLGLSSAEEKQRKESPVRRIRGLCRSVTQASGHVWICNLHRIPNAQSIIRDGESDVNESRFCCCLGSISSHCRICFSNTIELRDGNQTDSGDPCIRFRETLKCIKLGSIGILGRCTLFSRQGNRQRLDEVPREVCRISCTETSTESICFVNHPAEPTVLGIKDQKNSTGNGSKGEVSDCEDLMHPNSYTVEAELQHANASDVSDNAEGARRSDISLVFDYSQFRSQPLPDKPDLDVAFSTFSVTNHVPDVAHELKLERSHQIDQNDRILYFALRFPNAEAMKQRKIDQMQRAERTAEFLETAKSLSFQLSSRRRNSLLSTSSYASSVGSSNDACMSTTNLSATNNSDRGRRRQRRSSFLASSKIESPGSREMDSGEYGIAVSRRSSSSGHQMDAVAEMERSVMTHNLPNSHFSTETQQEQWYDELEQMRIHLGYEEIDVPLKSQAHVNWSTRKPNRSGNLSVLSPMRSRRRQGPRRSSFVAGSKIEVFESHNKGGWVNSSFRASM